MRLARLGVAPWFRITHHGRKVLASSEPVPHDPTGYLEGVKRRIPSPDATVMAYLAESVGTFVRGSVVASVLLLGVAAERVFDLLCDAMVKALQEEKDEAELTKLLAQFPMKPKLDWMHNKLQALQKKKLPGLPENSTLMITVVYDLLRNQRNELGHPREQPPSVSREEAFVNLLVFPTYYQTAERLRDFLSSNKV
jgi:hypothetical protein